MTRSNRDEIRAVHSAEVEAFFAEAGFLDALIGAQLSCHRCKKVITLDNFEAVTRKNGVLLFSCRDENCLQTLAAEAP